MPDALLRRSLILLSAGLLFALGSFACLVSAKGAPAPSVPQVWVDPDVVPRGEQATIKGKGWSPGSRVSLRIGLPESESYPVATIRANRKGRFGKRVRFRGLPGLYVLTACPASNCGRVRRALVRVVAPSAKSVTLLHTDLPRSRYLKRPKRVSYRAGSTPLPFDAIRLSGIKWSSWGGGSARATARARVCDGGACRHSPVRLVAKSRVRYESEEWFYSRLVVRFGNEAAIGKRRVTLCTLPAICGGPPGPP